LRITSRLKLLYLLHFSNPPADRVVYRAIRRGRPRKILELGLGDCRRAARMIEIASVLAPPREVHFMGVDLFEDRRPADGAGLPLKEAYQMLRGKGARVQLIPGDVLEGLSRSANALGKIDLLVISSQVDPDRLQPAWFFVPRMLHPQSQVYVESRLPDGSASLQEMALQEIGARATAAARRRAA